MQEIRIENYNSENKENIKNSPASKLRLFFGRILSGVVKIRKNDFFKNHIILWLLLFNFLTNLINWIILAIFTNKIDRGIILHYNVYFGVDNTGRWEEVFLMPAIGLILFLINLYLAFFFYGNRERIASYIALLAALMVQLSLIISSISVILINY